MKNTVLSINHLRIVVSWKNMRHLRSRLSSQRWSTNKSIVLWSVRTSARDMILLIGSMMSRLCLAIVTSMEFMSSSGKSIIYIIRRWWRSLGSLRLCMLKCLSTWTRRRVRRLVRVIILMSRRTELMANWINRSWVRLSSKMEVMNLILLIRRNSRRDWTWKMIMILTLRDLKTIYSNQRLTHQMTDLKN